MIYLQLRALVKTGVVVGVELCMAGFGPNDIFGLARAGALYLARKSPVVTDFARITAIAE
jgi:hypothetical protein